jgi:sporulation protein YlmC with PRC-barrel domain
MDVVRDVLDKRVIDRNGREVGRVDGVVLERRDGFPPRLAAIEIGPSVLGYRLHPIAGRWIEALEHACGVDAGRPTRIPVAKITVDADVKIALAIGETGAPNIERLLAEWIAKIPGADR